MHLGTPHLEDDTPRAHYASGTGFDASDKLHSGGGGGGSEHNGGMKRGVSDPSFMRELPNMVC